MVSLTLQDAQHVSWKIFGKVNAKLNTDRGKAQDPFVIVADILEGAGTVTAMVKGLEGLEPLEESDARETLAKGLNDMLYGVFVWAEHYRINLEETFLEHVNNHLLGLLT